MSSSISTIKSGFKKEELIVILNKFNLSITGTKQNMAERIFELKKTFTDLSEIIEIDKYGYLRSKCPNNEEEILCCICSRKGFEIDMYSCRTCKEGILCTVCMDNDNYEVYDDDYNLLCPICKTSKLYSNNIRITPTKKKNETNLI
jgi:hypothetical protein